MDEKDSPVPEWVERELARAEDAGDETGIKRWRKFRSLILQAREAADRNPNQRRS